MNIELKQNSNKIKHLKLSGEFDISDKIAVDDLMPELLDDSRGVILDLSEITYMDSAAFEFVISLSRRTKNAGIGMATVINDNVYVGKVFKELGLINAPDFKTFKRINEAEKSFG